MYNQRRITWSLEIALGMQGALVMHFLVISGEEHPGHGLYDRCSDTQSTTVLQSRIKTSSCSIREQLLSHSALALRRYRTHCAFLQLVRT